MSINEAINIQTTSINAITPTTGNINIGDLAVSNVMLTSKRLSNNQGFYLTGIEINEKAGGFLIEFQY
jgi:hypothetical protein